MGHGRVIIRHAIAELEGDLDGAASETVRVPIRGKVFQCRCLVRTVHLQFPFGIVTIITGGLVLHGRRHGDLQRNESMKKRREVVRRD